MRSAYLTLTLDSKEEAEGIYALLYEGGQILMPMEETFLRRASRCSGIGSGTSWMLLHPKAQNAIGGVTWNTEPWVNPHLLAGVRTRNRVRCCKGHHMNRPIAIGGAPSAIGIRPYDDGGVRHLDRDSNVGTTDCGPRRYASGLSPP